MTLEEVYIHAGGNFQAVCSRLCSEALVRRFALKYRDDPTFTQLCQAVSEEDWPTAFRAAHTLKGLAQNLGFSSLAHSADALTEALRGPQPLRDPALYHAVVSEQQSLLAALSQLEG